MKKILAAFAAGVLACACVLAPITLATNAQAQSVYGALAQDTADANAAAASQGAPVTYAQLTTSPAPIDGEVQVPWGQWLSDLIGAAFAIIFAGVLWAVRRMPENIVNMVDAIARAMGQGSMNELLEKAVSYGINVTQGAVRDQTLSLKVGNQVLERAAEYAMRAAPELVAKYGGLGPLRERIIARLQLDADAGIAAPLPPVEALIPGSQP